MNKKGRLSNIELLRIIAMFMVLFLHSIDALDIWPYAPQLSFSHHLGLSLIYFLSIVAVNTFVLISGWFGIKTTIKRILTFSFQSFFWGIGIYAVLLFLNQKSFSYHDLESALYLNNNSCLFVKTYLGLMLFAPILNAFIDKSTEKQLATSIITLLMFEFFLGWLFRESFSEINSGFSVFSFMILYLIGRYLNLYYKVNADRIEKIRLKIQPVFLRRALFKQKRVIFLSLYLFPLSVMAFASTLCFMEKNIHIVGYISMYSSPFIIFSSIMLLLFFETLEFHLKVINNIAMNVFAVYLLHMHPLSYPYFQKINILILENYSGVACFLLLLLLCVSVFMIACLLDKIRLYIWRLIEKGMIKNTI